MGRRTGCDRPDDNREAMTTAVANTHDPRPAEADSDAALKNRFVAWLATQPLPADRQHAYHQAIDRFFAWRRLHPGCGDPAWYYYSGLCGSTISEGQLEITREALALWHACQRAEPSATGHAVGSRPGYVRRRLVLTGAGDDRGGHDVALTAKRPS
jgi:hypothetical protein